jgi:hypothetical protein
MRRSLGLDLRSNQKEGIKNKNKKKKKQSFFFFYEENLVDNFTKWSLGFRQM